MEKKQDMFKKLNNPYYFLIFVLILTGILFLILSPRLSSSIFPFKRNMTFENFLKNTKEINSLDGKKYWEFREFYSPGYLNFSDTGLNESLVNGQIDKIGINYNKQNIDLNFLTFTSARLESLDMLTKQTDLNKLIDEKNLPKESIMFENKNSVIFKENPKTIKIIFLLSGKEMREANGFFDYTDKDKKITDGENWFNITTLSD